MAKTPKQIKGKKIIKVLTKNGYFIKSRGGSHITLSNGKIHVTVVIPFTSIGVFLKQIVKITGIPREEFL